MTLLTNTSLLKRSSLLVDTNIPVNLTLPGITGTAQSTMTLTASNGTWSNGPTSFFYQWYANGVGIGGATSATILLTDAQVGAVITVGVIAVNDVGPGNQAISAGTSAVTAAPALTNVLFEGDSITAFANNQRWNSINAASSPDSYARCYAFERTFLTSANTSVGGSTLGYSTDAPGTNSLWGRQASDIAISGLQAMSVLIGANDFDITNPTLYLPRVLSYVATFRNIGVKVAVGTILPHQGSSAWDTARAIYNSALRQQVGVGIDAVIDFDTCATGANGASSNLTYFMADQIHPTQVGQELMKTVYATAMDTMCHITSATILNPYLTRRGTQPSAGYLTNLTNFIIGLMTDNVWNEIQCLRIYADENSSDALLNVISSTFTASLIGSPTFTASRGYKGNGSNTAINEVIQPSNVYQDTLSFGTYINGGTDAAASAVAIGVYNPTISLISYIIPRNGSNLYEGTVNLATSGKTYGASSTIKGFSAIERSSSTLTTFYRSGSSTGTDATASAGNPAYAFYALAFNAGGTTIGNVSDFQIALSFVGRAMGSTKQTSLYNRVNTFLTALGAN